MKKRIVYFVSEDWYFYSHRLPVARIALKNGFRVVVVTNVNKHMDLIKSEGFELHPIKINRGGINPFADLKTIFELYKCYKKYKPNIVHHVAIKPVIYGTLVARIIGSIKIVNAMNGLGFVFVSEKLNAKIIRFFVLKMFRFLFNYDNLRLILQNKDDSNYFINNCLIREKRISIIRGSGVDTKKFYNRGNLNSKQPILMLASRMLWDKGVGEFVQAAREIKQLGLKIRFVLVGETDLQNPESVSEAQLTEWIESKCIEYWGKKNDMNKTLNQASIICLPSYREGLPKVLLEAASCEKPIIASNVPGCREIVLDGENGILVEPKDFNSIVEAIKFLVKNPNERIKMGKKGRKIVKDNFSEEIVADKTLLLYNEILHQ